MARGGRGAPRGHSDDPRGFCLNRLQKDLADVDPSDPTYKVEFPNPADIQHFTVTITPLKGLYRDGKYKFNFSIPNGWPHEAPDVRVATKVWHPNISELPMANGVCLSLLKKAYTPVSTIVSLIVGLVFLFLEPNPDDALNVEAGDQWRNNYEAFKSKAEDYREQYALD
jgi:ubiquitin-conjugating enzyme E2 M